MLPSQIYSSRGQEMVNWPDLGALIILPFCIQNKLRHLKKWCLTYWQSLSWRCQLLSITQDYRLYPAELFRGETPICSPVILHSKSCNLVKRRPMVQIRLNSVRTNIWTPNCGTIYTSPSTPSSNWEGSILQPDCSEKMGTIEQHTWPTWNCILAVSCVSGNSHD